MNSQLSRREFLKLLALAPLLQQNLPHFVGQADQLGQKPDSPNVFILVFDALSAYHMSLFGYRRKTTPNLERFAERATVYHDHYTGGNFTSSGTAWSNYGRGFASKSHDWAVLPACLTCHAELDHGAKMARADKQIAWEAAWLRWQEHIWRMGWVRVCPDTSFAAGN